MNWWHKLPGSILLKLVSLSLIAAESLPEEINISNVTLKNLRADLVQAEDVMHDLLNDHVDREFRIVCEYMAITGSLIEQRACEPDYRRQAKIRDFRAEQYGGTDRLQTTRSSDALNRDLAGQNQAFLDAAVRVLQLRNEIMSMDSNTP